jgi:hypothetical protein
MVGGLRRIHHCGAFQSVGRGAQPRTLEPLPTAPEPPPSAHTIPHAHAHTVSSMHERVRER